jgi:hypothetical protein
LALDAANEALGAARKATSATAAATPICLTMVILPLVGQDCPVTFIQMVALYTYTRANLHGPNDKVLILPIFTDVHFDERSFMKLKQSSSFYTGKLFYREVN